MTSYRAVPRSRIGHGHLHVSKLERSIAFYRDVTGFDLRMHLPEFAFLGIDGYHHHIGLDTWGTAGVNSDGKRRPSLDHFAFNYPTEADLADAVRHLVEVGHAIDGAADHHSHLAVYIADPDGNGIELAWDRDPSFWQPYLGGLDATTLQALNKLLDVEALIARSRLEFA